LIRTPDGMKVITGMHFQSKILLTIPLLCVFGTVTLAAHRPLFPYPQNWQSQVVSLWPCWVVIGYVGATVFGISKGQRITALRLFFEFLIVMYMLLVSFASTYYHWSAQPGCFAQDGQLSRVGAIYFSTVTTATVGCGDVYPKSDQCRVLVTGHIITDIFIRFLRRAVGEYRRRLPRRLASGGGQDTVMAVSSMTNEVCAV
jgi:hypothetical protein